MANDTSRNDIPWAEDARDFCIDHQEAGANVLGTAAAMGTRAELTAAGEFSAGAGVAFAVSGNEPMAAASGALATGFLNPDLQNTASGAAFAGTQHYANEHWGGLCDGVANGIDSTADALWAISQYAEQAPHPSYVDAKLGYDPATQSAPTFEIAPAHAEPVGQPIIWAPVDVTPQADGWFGWASTTATDPAWADHGSLFGTSSGSDAHASAASDRQPAADTSSHGLGSWFDTPSHDTSPSIFAITDTTSSSLWSDSAGTASTMSHGFGSLFGSSSDSSTSSGWGGESTSSHSDWGGASHSDGGGSSSSSHDSGSGASSMDGGM
jgi:hypothetical protein